MMPCLGAGLHTKRKELGNFDNAVKSKRQAVQGANASDHGQVLASEVCIGNFE